MAARWREKFEQLEWLLAATSRARTAVDMLTFVYRDPGTYGDDRVYLVRQGVVERPFPIPPRLSRGGFPRGGRGGDGPPDPQPGPLPLESVDEILLLMSWFRAHPDALRHTAPLADWLPDQSSSGGDISEAVTTATLASKDLPQRFRQLQDLAHSAPASTWSVGALRRRREKHMEANHDSTALCRRHRRPPARRAARGTDAAGRGSFGITPYAGYMRFGNLVDGPLGTRVRTQGAV